MKRLFALAAGLLPCFLAYSQASDEPGRSAGLTVASRIEANPWTELGNKNSGCDLGSSSLYTFLEGNITDNLSYYVENHWLSSEPWYLYEMTLHSDDVNWLNAAQLTLELGDFAITAGKGAMQWGTHEEDEYDIDMFTPMVSSIWNSFAIYQWGASAAWYYGDESFVGFQASSSPYTEHPFEDGVTAFSLMCRNVTDSWDDMISVNNIGMGDGERLWVWSVSTKWQATDSFSLGTSYTSRIGDMENIFAKGSLVQLFSRWEGDKFGAFLMVNSDLGDDFHRTNAGATLLYTPSEAFRFHASLGYSFGTWVPDLLSASIGLTYYFNVSL